tara:strand:+ start:839 stop:1564 length:726 start_codon:yes stop_codon:yes gene_type:complete
MNRISIISLLLIFVFQFLSYNNIQAQSLELTGDAYVSGNPSIPIASYIIVKNITSNSLDVRCQKNIIDTSVGTQNYFCWGINCWPSSVYVSPIPDGIRTIPAGFADSTNFTAYYDAAFSGIPSQARAIVEYCFYPQGNISDSTCLTVHFNDNTSFVDENTKEIGLGNFYPNPSKNLTRINYVAGSNSYLQILDILGNKIQSFELDNSGILEIPTSHFSSGIYFGNLISESRVVSVKKIIIN